MTGGRQDRCKEIQSAAARQLPEALMESGEPRSGKGGAARQILRGVRRGSGRGPAEPNDRT